MFKTATAARHFEVTNPGDSNLTTDHFVEVIGDVPAWVWRAAKPFDGPIPPNRPIFRVNTVAAAAELEAALAPQPPTPDSRKDAVKKRYGFVRDEQLTEAIGRLGFPNGRILTVEERLWNGEMQVSRHQQWTERELADFDESLYRVFPSLKR
jgi:hypothetical protein